MNLTESELIERAARAYLRWCWYNAGIKPELPSESRSEVVDGVVILNNVNGQIARYKVGKTRLINLQPAYHSKTLGSEQ